MYLFIFQDPFFARQFLGNPLEQYVWAGVILVTGFLFKHFISRFLTRQLFRICKKYATGVGPEKFLKLLVAPFNLFVMLFIAYLAFDRLLFPAEWNLAPDTVFGLRMVIYKGYLVLLVFSITWVFLRLADYFALVLMHRASETESKTDDQLVPFIKESIKIFIALFSLLFMLGSVFQVNVASLLAGLGIGGLAIALAAKESLENLLGSFTIFLDKPFILGDLIKVDKITGHVEKIGFRSTRLRTQEKTYVTVPNKKMVDGLLENLTMRSLYRVYFMVGLTYGTTSEKMREVIQSIYRLLAAEDMIAENPSVHFKSFNTSSLDIMVLYFVKTTEWEEYLVVRERINFEILKIVESNGCTFAYTTSRVILENYDESKPLTQTAN